MNEKELRKLNNLELVRILENDLVERLNSFCINDLPGFMYFGEAKPIINCMKVLVERGVIKGNEYGGLCEEMEKGVDSWTNDRLLGEFMENLDNLRGKSSKEIKLANFERIYCVGIELYNRGIIELDVIKYH